jgi:hypothetical protein
VCVLFGGRVEGKWKRARDVSRSKVWAWLGAVPLNLKSELILTISNPTKACTSRPILRPTTFFHRKAIGNHVVERPLEGV